jgi:hypothetical protein
MENNVFINMLYFEDIYEDTDTDTTMFEVNRPRLCGICEFGIYNAKMKHRNDIHKLIQVIVNSREFYYEHYQNNVNFCAETHLRNIYREEKVKKVDRLNKYVMGVVKFCQNKPKPPNMNY